MTRSPQYLAGVVDARRMILLDSTTARVDPLSTNTSISILRWDSFHRGSSFKWKLEHNNKVLHKQCVSRNSFFFFKHCQHE